MDETVHERNPRLVGSTLDLYDGSIADTKTRDFRSSTKNSENHSSSTKYDEAEQEANYFKSAQWYLCSSVVLLTMLMLVQVW